MLLYIFFVLFHQTLASPTGASNCFNPGTCMSADPKGQFVLTANSSTWAPGQTLSISLYTPFSTTFPGFLLYTVDSATLRVGTWTLQSGIKIRTGCNGTAGASITHDGSIQFPSPLNILWTAPTSGSSGPIQFTGIGVVSLAAWMQIPILTIPQEGTLAPTPTPIPVTPTPALTPTPSPVPTPTSTDVTPSPFPSPTDTTPSPTPTDAIPTPSPTPTDAIPTPSPTPVPSPTPTDITPLPTPSPSPTPGPAPVPAPTTGIDFAGMGYTVSAEIKLDSGMSNWVYWKPPPSKKRQTSPPASLDFAIQGATTGFVALGFTDGSYSMVASDAVVGWVTSAGVAVASAYHLTGQDVSAVVPNPGITVSQVSGSEINGVTTIFFTRDTASGFHPITTDQLFLISSHGPNDFLEYHEGNRSSALTISNISSGTTETVDDPSEYHTQIAHGVLMGVSYTILLPYGMMIARFGKSLKPHGVWFKLHYVLQGLAVLFVVVGGIMGFVVVGADYGGIPVGWHAYLGTALIAVTIINFLLGVCRPHMEEGVSLSTQRKIFNFVHPWTGRILILAAIAQCVKGILILDNAQFWGFVVYVPFVVAWMLVFIFFEFKTRKRPDGFEKV